MKKTSALFLLAVATLFPSVAPQAAESVSTRNFEVTFKRPSTPFTAAAERDLAEVKRLHDQGNLSSHEMSLVQTRMEDAVRQRPYIFSVQSRSGPLRELVEAFTQLKGVSLNLINAGEPSDLDAPLPPFTLRDARWGTIFDVLANLLELQGLQLKLAANEIDGSPLVCVLRPIEGLSPRRASGPDFDAFQLSDQISEAQTIDYIVDAIRTAWTLNPARDPDQLRLRFHPATNLLLVSGPTPAAAVAKQVVAALAKNRVQR